ncbi:glycosyltransferase family 2 protein [Vagococcus fluvialis]|uniref:glycosyltransferase family 2 protein n=1 Tax=Vagococcus fluvialis TaxID=2738 RepID=UPI001A8C5520|nr:glycosyltransferase [Vagococcus fluvialis]MBO0442878.1 glycosyltransferase [Vagococcus fluvialis]
MELLSVIMGTYNSEDRISRTIESIINQTYQNWELIIVNDCSTDETEEVLKRFARSDRRIKFLNNKTNKGLAYCLNRCIKESNGKYLVRIDDDDVCTKSRFEVQYNFISKNSSFSIVGGNSFLIDDENTWGERKVKESPNKFDVFQGRAFIHPTVMLNKSDLVEIGCYSEDKKYDRCEDYELWCRFYKNGYKGININENLIYYSEGKTDYKKRKKRYRLIFIKAMVEQKKNLEIGARGILVIGNNIVKLFIPNYFIYLLKTKQ